MQGQIQVRAKECLLSVCLMKCVITLWMAAYCMLMMSCYWVQLLQAVTEHVRCTELGEIIVVQRFIVEIKCAKCAHFSPKIKCVLSALKSALLQFSFMFCGVIAFWKLESKCKRLLWTEYWYSRLTLTWILKQWSASNRSLYSAGNLSYLRSYGNEKVKNLQKCKVRLHNKVR